jgi:phospholipid/cholesterol/gamma-HCH transport system substrate-binding protein
MSKHANPTVIGAFVVGAVILAIAAILLLSSGDLFIQKPRFVLYFKGSVKGLNVGSPVNFRGVNIGTVTNIQLVMGESGSDIRIPVTIEINPANFIRSDQMIGQMNESRRKKLAGLIDAGMRAQLQLQSLLTGQLFIQLDFYPGTRVDLVGDDRYPEIPTIPTPIEKITKKLEDFPVEQVMNNIISTTEGLNKLVNSPELHQSIQSLNETMENINRLVKSPGLQKSIISLHTALEDLGSLARNVNKQVEPLGSELHDTLNETRLVMSQARATLESAQQLVSDQKMLYAIDNALAEITAAARSVRDLTDYLERQPQSLLRGKTIPGGN